MRREIVVELLKKSEFSPGLVNGVSAHFLDLHLGSAKSAKQRLSNRLCNHFTEFRTCMNQKKIQQL